MSLFKSLGRAVVRAWTGPTATERADLAAFNAGLRTQKPRSGTDRIEAAIGKFTAIADELAAGVEENALAISENNNRIAELYEQNKVLTDAMVRGQTVEAKLRDLIS